MVVGKGRRRRSVDLSVDLSSSSSSSVAAVDRLVGRSIARRSAGRPFGRRRRRSVGPSVGRSVVVVVGRRRSSPSIGRSVHKSSVGRLVGRSVGNLVSSSQWAHMGYLNSDLGFTCLQRAPRSVTQERPRVTARGAFFSASEGPGKGPRQPRDCSKRFPRGPQDRSRKRRFA